MKIGHNFETNINESDIEKIIDIGGYKVIIKNSGEVLIQGIHEFSINKALIGTIGIIPLDEEAQMRIEDFPFKVEKHRLIFQITFNNFAWYFKEKSDAFTLMSTILQVKENALHAKFFNTIKDNL